MHQNEHRFSKFIDSSDVNKATGLKAKAKAKAWKSRAKAKAKDCL